MTLKNYFLAWEEHVKKLLNTTPVPVAETKLQQQKRMKILEADPEKWFKYYFPGESAEPAPFHKEATKRVLNNPEWYEVRMWSRELAKSTRTMMEVLYLTLVGYNEKGLSQNTPPSYSPLGAGGRTKQPHNAACHADAGSTSTQPYETQSSSTSTQPHETHTSPEGAQSHSGGHRPSKQHILLISSSLDNAARLLIPYKANLEYNPRIINDYGHQQNYGKWTNTEFTTRKGVSFRAVGASQPPRGAKNENNVRPDVILFDDVDTDSDCRNPEMINKTWNWIEEAAISTRSISNPTTIIFCGNRIAVDCCVVRACNYADHIDEINIVDAEGNPSWPQKNTKEHIDRVLKQKSYASAQKEYFNNPITEGAVFKQMNYKPIQPLHEYKMLICYTDPSYKDSIKNDYKATVLVGKWREEFHIIKCFVEQTSTAQMIDWHYQIIEYLRNPICHPEHREGTNPTCVPQPQVAGHPGNLACHADVGSTSTQHESRNMSPFRDRGAQNTQPRYFPPSEGPREAYFCMEEVLLQDLILDEFYKEGRNRGKTIPIMGDQRRKGHKYTRIEALLEPLHRNNLLYLNEAEKHNPHMKRLDEQFLAFAPGSRAHDDAPDAVEGAIWLINSKTTAATTISANNVFVLKRTNSKRF